MFESSAGGIIEKLSIVLSNKSETVFNKNKGYFRSVLAYGTVICSLASKSFINLVKIPSLSLKF